jgi:DNA topoisomerase VI subunit B
MTPALKRQTFTVSRELEYFSKSELITQTGCAKEHWWPGVIVKELLDNALDACEQAQVTPQIRTDFGEGVLAVADKGPGVPAKLVRKIVDFATRTSDKAAYVFPTRGAQGNALKTILTIPDVLN